MKTKEYLDTVCNLLKDTARFSNLIRLMKTIRRSEGILWVFGNGGSSATASHFVNDLVKVSSIRAFCLSDNTPLFSAYSNDDGYNIAVSRILEKLGKKNDTLFLLSCSGNSPNTLAAAKRAREMGIFTIALTGFDGGNLKNLVDYHVNIPSYNYRICEDIHLILCHLIVERLLDE